MIWLKSTTVTVLLAALFVVTPSGSADQPLDVRHLEGVILKNSTYQDYNLGRAVQRRKVILVVYPGYWDPYSVHTLKVLRNLDTELAGMNIQVIAVSMDSPVNVKKVIDDHKLPFVVISDPDSVAAKRLDATEPFTLEKKEKLQQAGISLGSGVSPSVLPKLHLFIFREDGSLAQRWYPETEKVLISADEIKDMVQELSATNESLRP